MIVAIAMVLGDRPVSADDVALEFGGDSSAAGGGDGAGGDGGS